MLVSSSTCAQATSCRPARFWAQKVRFGTGCGESGDHVDASFEASKVKVGESITLTVTTKACDGEPAINAPFVIR
ncbi:hypothetical protein HIN56_24020, partial [Salmonella enterica subsp. enterica serovar Choleraesuis]|nr:hypothetical protein [Salmonella enterica subsp. enterica serovar Choleraesuis]